MKIAICVNGRPHEGGITTSVNEYSENFRKLGHLVDVITIFGCHSFRIVKPNLVKNSDKILKSRPVLTFLIYQLSKIILFFHIYKNYFLKKYNLILAMDFSTVNIAYPLKKFFKVKIARFYFGSISELINQGKLKEKSLITNYFIREDRKSIIRADVIFSSTALIPGLKKLSEKYAPVFLIKSAVNPKKFYPDQQLRQKTREKYGILDEQFVLLFCGRLDPRKGVLYPAQAIQELVNSGHKNYLLLFAGEGIEKNNLEKFILKNNLQNYIKILGTINHEEIPNLYRAADCLLFTSIYQDGIYEPIAISLLEAMASGLPLITFLPPANAPRNELLVAGRNCLQVPEKDFHALAGAIDKLNKNPELKNILITNARADLFAAGWTPQAIVNNILKTIDEINN